MTAQAAPAVAQSFADASRDHIVEVLEQCRWIIGGRGGAAERLGLPRTTLIYKMSKLGIETRRPRRRAVQFEPAFADAGSYGSLAAAL
jgi:transcriptional regulator with GAF, ATPase, and Fis domain